jgi:hypothetical protein
VETRGDRGVGGRAGEGPPDALLVAGDPEVLAPDEPVRVAHAAVRDAELPQHRQRVEPVVERRLADLELSRAVIH